MKRILLIAAGAAVALTVFAFSGVKSGLEVGESVTPFHPTHLSGPDKGTDTCPPCKYGARPAVQVWNNGDTAKNLNAIAKVVSEEVADSKADLKGFVVNLTMCTGCEDKAKGASATAPSNIGYTILKNTDGAIKNYKVNIAAEMKNTVFVYKNKKVVAKFVNLEANEQGIAGLRAAISKAESQ